MPKISQIDEVPCQAEVRIFQKITLNHFIGGDKSSLRFNLHVIIMNASQVCSHHSFGLPLIRMNGIHRKQFDHSHLDLFSCHLESDHACLEHLSLETSTKHSVGVKAFSSFIVVTLTPTLFFSCFQ